jgi:hypothetical protein
MTGLDRRDWPPTKRFDVVQNGPCTVDIIAKQNSTPKELEEVAAQLILDMVAFEYAGRKVS